MFQLPNSRKEDIQHSDILNRLGLKEGQYFVVSLTAKKKYQAQKQISYTW